MGGVEYIDGDKIVFWGGYRFEGRGKGESVRVISQRLSLLTIAEEEDIFG